MYLRSCLLPAQDRTVREWTHPLLSIGRRQRQLDPARRDHATKTLRTLAWMLAGQRGKRIMQATCNRRPRMLPDRFDLPILPPSFVPDTRGELSNKQRQYFFFFCACLSERCTTCSPEQRNGIAAWPRNLDRKPHGKPMGCCRMLGVTGNYDAQPCRLMDASRAGHSLFT